MDTFTRDDLKSLLAIQAAHCLTITLPADPAQPQAAQILLKNLYREALRQLCARGLREPEARQLLEPIEALTTDPLYWREQAGGLAIFHAGDFFRTYCVPMPLEAHVAVRDRFVLSSLIPLLTGDGRFFVLALSQKQVRLLAGSRASIAEVGLDGVPTSLGEALKDEVIEKDAQFRARQPSAGRHHSTTVYGYASGPEEDDKERIERFFREVDRGLQSILRGERSPLVLAGVDYLLPIYRAVSTYPLLAKGGVAGNPETLRPSDLQQKAWAIVQPMFESEQRQALAQFDQLAKSERASTDLHKVIPAAYYGQVETLLIPRGIRQWGHFEPETGRVVVHKTERPEAEDLLDFAAIHTIMHDGAVYTVTPDVIPKHAPVAAVLRY